MQTRKPVVAGQFYPGQHDSCIEEINRFLDAEVLSESLPERIVAGIAPHAGWTFSGSLAALAFSSIKQQCEKVHTFVIFGAHYIGRSAAVCDRGFWETPLGQVAIDEELADAVLSGEAAVSDPDAHRFEHSIEVQIPFIQYLFAGARILPILVPPTKQAIVLGASIGQIVSQDENKDIVCIGSTDLTHYGPRYGFTPKGIGGEALKWAHKVNDRKFIDLAQKLEAEGLLASAAENCNACGPGGVAAAVTAAKKLGKKEGLLLAHTSSSEVMLSQMGVTSTDSVGYAAMVF